jgi:pimeloyl-ACP methyl ester carboxylesterase
MIGKSGDSSPRVGTESDLWCLLHGTPLTPAVWDDVSTQLSERGGVMRPVVALTPDESDTVTDLARRLLDDLPPAATPHLVGHSFGGQVALEMALLAPDRIRSLTMICSRDTPYPAFRLAAAAVRSGPPIDPATTLRRWFTPAELEAGSPMVHYARRCLRDVDRSAWAAALDAIAGYDRSEPVATLRSPLTLIAASLDQVSTVPAMQALADRVPGSRLTVLDGAGHMSPFLRPDMLVQLLGMASHLSR